MNLKTAAFVGLSLILVFIAGRFTAPTVDKELVKKYELERESYIKDVEKRVDSIDLRVKGAVKIVQKMKEDDRLNSIALKKNNDAYLKLIKQNEKINYHDASIPKLDSARAKYLTLYTH